MKTAVAPRVFRLPDLGEGLTEAEVLEWKVAVGDTVEVDQVVVEVETAKAAVEVPVPFAGTVLKLHAGPGAVLGVGEPLIEVGDAGAASASEDPAAARYREEEQAGSGNVLIGYGTGGASGTSRRRGRTRPAEKAAGDAVTAAARPKLAPRVISPLVRRIAREHGVDIAAVTPTGPRGVILRRDVEQAIAAAPAEPVAPAEPAAAGPAGGLADERIPLRGLRRAVADKLTRSRAEIPDATTWVDVDATGLLDVRDALRRTRPDLGIGLLALLARVCVSGLRRFPELNSSVDTGRGEIVRHGRVNLGFAAQTDRGLVVPVVRDAHLMTTGDLAAELARLTGLARAGKLPPEALTGGTFTLNNYGVFGVDGSTPIINHPEAALLGVGRFVDRPWVHDGAVVPRKVAQLSLTFDHRVCDGGTAGGFLRYVADCVEDPSVLIAHS
ncbi:dihydrolipoamide acetyltransferase family protein [Actinomadura montaniterrae]|uniref:Dihydrolipoamide acetyltransferase component of pyruvate dehydrogenase complex n=1 Tax=Actinomadura montaniterrae TaxID=1803903 RepID=A0A6L3VT69_9ACTN|nr:dihydrolipoamide acetyltransferase family protein [Actinomadura montaniterrae]KAB2374840.1 2-oxo acid dehydrogenase subunit E2 [Actinomadura montaniterrae]